MEEREDIKIDGNIATWEINTVGEILGTYIGTFRFKCFLTPLEQIAAGKLERELIGPNMALANEHETFLAFALAQLKFRVVSAPPFWASSNPGNIQGDIPDEPIINMVLSAAIDSEAKYKKQIKERKENAIKRAKAVSEAITKQEIADKEENEKLENE
jgi:hypothetical protein